jgi:hypothetical protein
MKHGWTKDAFWDVNKKNDVNGVSLFHLCYLIMLMIYLCSQWTSNPQIKYFMFGWSIYRLFELNRGWKSDSLQILLFVHVSSTWSIGELKTRFERWITRNDVNGENLLYISNLVTLIAYLCSQGHNMSKSIFLYLSRLWTDNLCQIRPGNVILSNRWYSKLFVQHEAWLK